MTLLKKKQLSDNVSIRCPPQQMHQRLVMFLLLFFFVPSYASGRFADEEKRVTYLPKLMSAMKNEVSGLDTNNSYCLHFTWLGMNYDNHTFHLVANKTCSEFFKTKEKPLCIDPMAVTFTGKKPNISYILQHHTKDATCKLSEDQVCAKYTIYYNGIASHEARYCTRIYVDSEGPMRSGCVTETRGAYSYEVCACKSEPGRVGICNLSAPISSSSLALFAAFLAFLIHFLHCFHR